jgi:hypothetical protein
VERERERARARERERERERERCSYIIIMQMDRIVRDVHRVTKRV